MTEIGYVDVPPLAGGDEGDYLLRAVTPVEGEHILPGDWLVVARQDTAEPGDLVTLESGDAVTVRRFVEGERFPVRGRVVGLMRAIERADLERSNSPEEES